MNIKQIVIIVIAFVLSIVATVFITSAIKGNSNEKLVTESNDKLLACEDRYTQLDSVVMDLDSILGDFNSLVDDWNDYEYENMYADDYDEYNRQVDMYNLRYNIIEDDYFSVIERYEAFSK